MPRAGAEAERVEPEAPRRPAGYGKANKIATEEEANKARERLRKRFEAAPACPAPVSENERAVIDQLIAATRLYNSSDAIRELEDFTVRLRAFAPFNALLLHIQRPGLTHAATARDWKRRFDCEPKEGARPLVILRVMGPADFVFDIQDIQGREDLPVDAAFTFPTYDDLDDRGFDQFMRELRGERIEVREFEAGDGHAGWIKPLLPSDTRTGKNSYRLAYNRKHPAPTRFVTVAHELAHLYLGHLGPDRGRGVPDRRWTDGVLREVEAEMTAYLVAKRNGLKPKSESYLADYQGAFDDLDLYGIFRAANAVETALGISALEVWRRKGLEELLKTTRWPGGSSAADLDRRIRKARRSGRFWSEIERVRHDRGYPEGWSDQVADLYGVAPRAGRASTAPPASQAAGGSGTPPELTPVGKPPDPGPAGRGPSAQQRRRRRPPPGRGMAGQGEPWTWRRWLDEVIAPAFILLLMAVGCGALTLFAGEIARWVR